MRLLDEFARNRIGNFLIFFFCRDPGREHPPFPGPLLGRPPGRDKKKLKNYQCDFESISIENNNETIKFFFFFIFFLGIFGPRGF